MCSSVIALYCVFTDRLQVVNGDKNCILVSSQGLNGISAGGKKETAFFLFLQMEGSLIIWYRV